jgi:hypothetical protein
VSIEHTFGGPADRPYFAVRAGVSKREALLHATCAVNSVHQRLTKAIGDGEVDIGEAWLMREALEAAEALLQACE